MKSFFALSLLFLFSCSNNEQKVKTIDDEYIEESTMYNGLIKQLDIDTSSFSKNYSCLLFYPNNCSSCDSETVTFLKKIILLPEYLLFITDGKKTIPFDFNLEKTTVCRDTTNQLGKHGFNSAFHRLLIIENGKVYKDYFLKRGSFKQIEEDLNRYYSLRF